VFLISYEILDLEHRLGFKRNLEGSLRRSFPSHINAALEGEYKIRPYEKVWIDVEILGSW
jgi:hypothetical protein